MYTGAVQRITPFVYPHKSGTLLEGLWPELCHLQKLLTALKAPVFLPVSHDIFRKRPRNAGNIRKQRCRCRVQVHAHPVHTVFHHTAQSFAQPLLVHIMLVLPHPDGLRIYFNQLCQRILKPPRYGYCAPLSHIEFRKFLRRQLACRVDRCTRLIDDHILHLFRNLL